MFRFFSVTSLFVGTILGVVSSASADNEQQQWLESRLPPLIDAKKGPPFEITNLSIKRNSIGQELLRGDYRRSWLITFLPREVKLVILPSGGGRYAMSLWGPVGIVNGPGNSDVIGGITDNLLDFRGEIPGGARAYLEMWIESPDRVVPRFRISKVRWLGTDQQLAAAMKNGPPPALKNGDSAGVKTTELPTETSVVRGVPLRYRLGDFHRKATVWEDSAEGPITVLVFLTRPGGLYQPWIAQAERKDIRIEPQVLEELKQTPEVFNDLYENAQRNLSRHEAPHNLVAAADQPIKVGERLMQFALGSLQGVEVVDVTEEGVVRVRSSTEGEGTRRQLAHLYIDPAPAPLKKSGAATIQPRVSRTSTSSAEQFVPLEKAAKLKVKDKLKAKWGGRWYDVEVLELAGDGKVKIHWVGWGSNWDEVRAFNTLFRDPAAAPAKAKPAEEFRLWQDRSGVFELEAALVEVQGENVVLKRKSDGKIITIPLKNLSDADSEFIRSTDPPEIAKPTAE